jgi:hypothetical protein
MSANIAIASWPEIQDRLSQAFLYALATKAILSDERSLDLFTGLLVFLAWQHHYLSQQQTYQKLCLLAGMATDLGLYRSDARPKTDPGHTLEEDRAFVGAYYLCCGLAAKSQDKPGPLRWTDNLRRSAQNAAHSGTLPTDRTLIGVVELTHTMDGLEEDLRSCSLQTPEKYYVDLSAKSSLHQLELLRRGHPSLNGTLGFAAATIKIYQQRLRYGDSTDSTILIKCACALKEYLDELLARPPATLHQMAVVGWADFLEIVLLMAQVSRPSHAAGWEAGAVSSMLEPDAVLDSICAHMASTPTDDPLTPRSDALLQWVYTASDCIKKLLIGDSTGSTNGQHRSGHVGYDVSSSFGADVLNPAFWNELVKGS